MQLRRARALRRLINCTHAIAMGTRILKLPVHKFMNPHDAQSLLKSCLPLMCVMQAGGVVSDAAPALASGESPEERGSVPSELSSGGVGF